jgi:PAS domain S-box-containing protein
MEIKEKKEEEKISILLEDLASLESYARDLFSFLPIPICLVSSIGIILEANPAFEEISGYKIEELVGKPIEEIFKKEEIEELTNETLEKGFVKGKETSILTKEKKKIPVSISAKLRKSEEGEIIGYFLGFFDLSNIKKTETELRDRLEELEKFHRITVGRELKMMELKKEIEKFKKELEKYKGRE